MSDHDYNMVDFSNFGAHFLESILDLQMTEEDTTATDNVNNENSPGPSSTTVNTPQTENKTAKPKQMINPFNLLSNAVTIKKTSPKVDTEIGYKIQKNALINALFKPEYIKDVFEVQDDPLVPSTEYSEKELEYQKQVFSDLLKVPYGNLHCTICATHIGCGSSAGSIARIHRILKVLICDKCYQFYGDGNFPKDDSDGSEIYCRWCGQGGVLVCCSFCPIVFCKKCIKRNLGAGYEKKIESASEWACVCCAVKPIWPLRATCSALLKYIEKKGKSNPRDLARCCAKKVVPQTSPQPVKVPGGAIIKKVKPVLPKPPVQYSAVTKSDPPPLIFLDEAKTQRRITLPASIKPMIVTKPVLPNVTIPPGITANFVATNLCTPIIRGATPIRTITQVKPLQITRPLTTPLNITNTSEMATAKVPVNPNGLVLRMKLPNGSVFLVKLVTDEKTSDEGFRIPEFKSKFGERDFFENALMDTFKLEKMIYERIMILKKLHDTKTSINEKEIMSTIAKKMHFILSKSSESFSGLDKHLQEEFESWKLNRKKKKTQEVDVIDLSDEEDSNTFKIKDGAGFSTLFTSKMSEVFKEDEDMLESSCKSVHSCEENDHCSVKSDDCEVINAFVKNDEQNETSETTDEKPETSDLKKKFNLRECKVTLEKNNCLQRKRKNSLAESDSENSNSSSSSKKAKINGENEENSDDDKLEEIEQIDL